MKPETLKRWGVVFKNDRKDPGHLLGWSWWPGAVCANAQAWPAVWMTRNEAMGAATEKRASARLYGSRWRFRVVRVDMTVRVKGSR